DRFRQRAGQQALARAVILDDEGDAETARAGDLHVVSIGFYEVGHRTAHPDAAGGPQVDHRVRLGTGLAEEIEVVVSVAEAGGPVAEEDAQASPPDHPDYRARTCAECAPGVHPARVRRRRSQPGGDGVPGLVDV